MTTLVEIASIVVVIASITGAVASIFASIQTFRNTIKIQEVHISINSRMDQLLQARGAAAMAAGIEQGRNENTNKIADLGS